METVSTFIVGDVIAFYNFNDIARATSKNKNYNVVRFLFFYTRIYTDKMNVCSSLYVVEKKSA